MFDFEINIVKSRPFNCHFSNNSDLLNKTELGSLPLQLFLF